MRPGMSLVVTALAFALASEAVAGDISRQANQEYLEANARKPGVTVLSSGLQYRVIKAGAGQTPMPQDVVTVAYKGMRVDDYVFDETKPGETRNLPVNKVIPGWVEALSLMKEGDEWELVVPAALGYGANRMGDGIPPNQTLIFDLQLIAIVHGR